LKEVYKIEKVNWRSISNDVDISINNELLNEVMQVINVVILENSELRNYFLTPVLNENDISFCTDSQAEFKSLDTVTKEVDKEVRFQLRDWTEEFLKTLNEVEENNFFIKSYLTDAVDANNIKVFVAEKEGNLSWSFAWGHQFANKLVNSMPQAASRTVKSGSVSPKIDMVSVDSSIKSHNENLDTKHETKIDDMNKENYNSYNEQNSLKSFTIKNWNLLGWFVVILLVIGLIHRILY
tara:strand:- start:1108 stop:1821 length:714 start_codon:yes stop_codon:yes gene_type:complete